MIRCSFDEVRALTDDHPAVRDIDNARRGPAWRDDEGRTVAFSGLDAEGRVHVVIVLGSPHQAAALLGETMGELPDGARVCVPRGTPVRLVDADDWNFRATYYAPPPQPAESRTRWLDADAAEEIADLLKVGNPGSSAWPGDDKVRRWAGVADSNGVLLACLADTSRVPSVGHISAIAVHPDARGRRLGPSITAWATRRMITDGCDVVTLGVYADNDIGLRMYDRLGFTIDYAFTGGVLTPPPRATE